MRAMVVSGGGNKGAYAGGVADYLIRDIGLSYDLFLGSSTGSLIVPHLAIGRVEKIKKIFTNAHDSDIFSSNPFVERKHSNTKNTVDISLKKILKAIVTGQKTFGTSEALLRLIRRSFTFAEFYLLQKGHIDVVVTVTNLTKGRTEYKSINDFTYQEFCEWMWISCNFMPFMTLCNKNEDDYADGSHGSMVPIEEAILRGATEIDVIVLKTKDAPAQRPKSKNALVTIAQTFQYMNDQIEWYNIELGNEIASRAGVKLNYFYLSEEMNDHPLKFDPLHMKQLWGMGKAYAHQHMQQIHQESVYSV